MYAAMRRRGRATRRTSGLTAIATIGALVMAALSATPAQAADPLIEWTTTATMTETVTVTETATYNGYTGTGSATSTKTATGTGTAKEATNWEVYYWATVRAQQDASTKAKAAADAEARPIAKQRALADAQAKAAAGPVYIEWSTTAQATESVTVTATATVNGYTGTGTATSTKTATGTGSAKELTNWEAFYWATVRAQQDASTKAKAAADADARAIAKQRAQADAQAKADAGPVWIEWTTSATVTESVTVTETAMVGDFEGEGTATVTKTATATGYAKELTNWETYYWATVRAQQAASDQAKEAADTEARALAKQRALEDAQAQADAAAQEPEPTPTTPSPTPTTPGSTPTPTPTPTPTTPAGPSCGSAKLKADGTPWVCTFADNFTGSALDSAKWSPVRTESSSFSYGDCFTGAGPNITVADGALSLKTRKESSPVTCKIGSKTITSNYTSGSVTSLGKFSQTYGRFEIRAAMPQSSGPGLQSALWLVPDAPNFYGAWPYSGEIDVAEYYTQYPDRLVPALHYGSTAPWDQRTNNQCLVYKPTEYHTYVLEWTTTKLKVTIDGTTCVDHTLSPLAPLLGSAPFDKPFNLNLTQMLGSGDNAFPSGSGVDEATMKVDYVRVWK